MHINVMEYESSFIVAETSPLSFVSLLRLRVLASLSPTHETYLSWLMKHETKFASLIGFTLFPWTALVPWKSTLM
jgi:hypothetical protein